METIRLRVWDGAEMRQVGEIRIKPSISNPYTVFDEYGQQVLENGFSVIPPEWVMQYINLKDCSGKDICQGDIMKGANGNVVVVVRQGAEFIMKKKIQAGYSEKWFGFLCAPEEKQFEEVIGNIFENPELLESAA